MDNNHPLRAMLSGRTPRRFVYAPNYWQWFTHRINHNALPPEIAHITTQLELIQYLGLDVFSRNIYCNPYECWFGGLSREVFDRVEKVERRSKRGNDLIIDKVYETGAGLLKESLQYIHAESTLVQKKYLVDDYENQLAAFEAYVRDRRWEFQPEVYKEVRQSVADGDVVVAGEFFSPLKMFHMTLGLADTTYFVVFHPEKASELAQIHETAQLHLLETMLKAGIEVCMSMDNLDSMFHPPGHVEAYSASFYAQASALCHDYGARFMIHACGQQKANLPLISSLGVDGLEGVAYPPLGDVELEEAFDLVHDRFMITGGISAHETENLKTRSAIYRYTEDLFRRMQPYAGRFLFSASCNTAINTPWDTLKYFRDAWQEYGQSIQV